MSSIVGYTSRGTVDAAAGPAGSRAVDSGGFGRPVKQWRDLPAESRAFDDEVGELLDEGIEEMSHFARKINGQPHQVCVAWRAYIDRIIVVRLVRPLTQRPDGRSGPAGPWQHLSGGVYRASGNAKRTRGVVASLVSKDSQPVADIRKADLPAEHKPAAFATAHLPMPVQGTLSRAVPEPEVWLSTFWQASQSGSPSKQHVAVLRIGGSKAVLAVAERANERWNTHANYDGTIDSVPWSVTQVEYTLLAGAVSGAANAQQIGGAR